MGPKRNRFLIRQPRIKRDSDTGTSSHHSPEIEVESGNVPIINTSPILPTNLSGNISLHAIPSLTTNYLSVPTPKIERHSSEPAPSVPLSPPLQVSTSSAHLLNIPAQHHHQHHLQQHPHHQHAPFLVKQHSHPLLPSQQAHLSSSPSSAPISGNQSSFELQRQYSQPVETTTPPSISISTTMTGSGSVNPGATSNFMQFGSGGLVKNEQHGPGPTSSVILLPEPTGSLMTGSFEHTQSLRVRTDELHRSISTPVTVSFFFTFNIFNRFFLIYLFFIFLFNKKYLKYSVLLNL